MLDAQLLQLTRRNHQTSRESQVLGFKHAELGVLGFASLCLVRFHRPRNPTGAHPQPNLQILVLSQLWIKFLRRGFAYSKGSIRNYQLSLINYQLI